jgi:hypothetical protein
VGVDSFFCSLSDGLDLLATINTLSPLNIALVWLLPRVQSRGGGGFVRNLMGTPDAPFLVVSLTLLNLSSETSRFLPPKDGVNLLHFFFFFVVVLGIKLMPL